MPRDTPGKYKGHQLREVVGSHGDLVTVLDRRPYWQNYYKANRERIRARQDPYIRERRRLAKILNQQQGGKLDGEVSV